MRVRVRVRVRVRARLRVRVKGDLLAQLVEGGEDGELLRVLHLGEQLHLPGRDLVLQLPPAEVVLLA